MAKWDNITLSHKNTRHSLESQSKTVPVTILIFRVSRAKCIVWKKMTVRVRLTPRCTPIGNFKCSDKNQVTWTSQFKSTHLLQVIASLPGQFPNQRFCLGKWLGNPQILPLPPDTGGSNGNQRSKLLSELRPASAFSSIFHAHFQATPFSSFSSFRTVWEHHGDTHL